MGFLPILSLACTFVKGMTYNVRSVDNVIEQFEII